MHHEDLGLGGIDHEIAAALDPEELAELQQALIQQMHHDEHGFYGDEEEDEEQDPGFIQNVVNQFN